MAKRWTLFLCITLIAAYCAWNGALSEADGPLASKLFGFSSDSDSVAMADLETADAGPKAAHNPAIDEEYYQLYKLLVDTIDQVERNYVKKVDRRELFEAAIEGVLRKLDPHSSYISPDEISRFRTNVESQFGGLGIRVSHEDDALRVISPLVGTPAYRAGLMAGDLILEIDGTSTEGLLIDDAVQLMKGPAGTSVTLKVKHSGDTEPIDVEIKREIIHVETVLGHHRGEDDDWDYILDPQHGIAYIRLTAFSRETATKLKAVVESLTVDGTMRGLILDLRFNPGGLLTSAIEISDMFISQGRIVSTEGRNSPERVWSAEEKGTFEGFPMVVMVNRFSASASEIVSACLQDHDRAIVIGERTWGKGSVQNVIELEGGASILKLTTAGYLRPNGKNIHRFPDMTDEDEWGVKPNDGFRIRLSHGELYRLIAELRDRDIVLPHEVDDISPDDDDSTDDDVSSDDSEDESTESLAFEPIKDRQLKRATEYLVDELTKTEEDAAEVASDEPDDNKKENDKDA